MTLSIVIPARNEMPNLVHSIYSCLHAWEAEGYDWKDIEIIVVDNCSTDIRHANKPGVWGTLTYLCGRSALLNRVVRIAYDPIAGNHSARNIGAKMARGKYVFFSDGHMAYRPGCFTELMKTVDECKGIVHCPIAWMGAYPPPSGAGYAYTIKLGEEIKGTWNNYTLGDGKDWWYIPALGHCSLMVDRKQFLDLHGYPGFNETRSHTRSYGGGEFYLNMKWWMMGKTVAVAPQAIGYHLASERGYSYNHIDYVYNVLAIGYALGMDDWRERAYLNWLRSNNKNAMEHIWEQSAYDMENDRKFIEKHRKKTFNRLIAERPWEKLNDKKFGKHINTLLVYHDTWVNLIHNGIPDKGIPPAPPYVIEQYENSQLQKDLDKFINENLSEFVYRR